MHHSLNLWGNNILDISALENITHTLDLSFNVLKDFSPLKNMKYGLVVYCCHMNRKI